MVEQRAVLLGRPARRIGGPPPVTREGPVSQVTTHVLDQSLGRPATNIKLQLEWESPEGSWRPVGRSATNADGRCGTLIPEGRTFFPGRYRLTFDTGVYFARLGVAAFYPEIQIQFEVTDTGQHYHVPLLLSPFGYSTYRGS